VGLILTYYRVVGITRIQKASSCPFFLDWPVCGKKRAGKSQLRFLDLFFDHDNLNWTWQIAELFKIEKGNIRRIEAFFSQVSIWYEFRMEHLRAGDV
jgi:hypothetical protein